MGFDSRGLNTSWDEELWFRVLNLWGCWDAEFLLLTLFKGRGVSLIDKLLLVLSREERNRIPISNVFR